MEVLMTNESKAPAAGGAPKKLSARGLVKRFDGKEVLHALDFDVLDGEFLSILGPSGCGKTVSYTHLDVYKRQGLMRRR